MKDSNGLTQPSKKKKIASAAAIIAFILFTVAVFWYVGRPMLRFVSEPDKFRDWVDERGVWGRLAFLGMVIFQVVIAIIPGEPLEIGAGYAFGILEGTFLCVLGLTIGSLLIFLMVRTLGVRLVEVFFSYEKIQSLKFLQNTRRLNLLTFIIFFIPGTPKDLLSYFVGLTKIKLSTWLLIASVARLPSVITSTVGGSALGLQRYKIAIAVFTGTLLVSGAGLLIYRLICRYNDKKINFK